MAITQATSSVLATNAALNNLNAGANITFTKQVIISSLSGAAFGTGVTTALAATANTGGGLVTANGTSTLTNKTIDGANNTITNVSITSSVSGLGSGIATFLATPTSANLAAAVTDETGSGSLVLANSPTLTSPSIAGTAQFTGTNRPTSAATGSPAATDLITRADGVNETIFNMARIQRSDHAQSYTANGGTSNLVDGDNFATGTAANNRPVCVRYRQINRFGSGQLPTVCPIRIASFLAFAHPGSLNAGGRLRCAIGMASGASVPAGDANALNGRGFGWEIFWDGSNIVFGLFAHDGTNYVRNDGISGRQAPVPIGQPPSNFDVFSHIIVGLNSSGVVSAQAIFVNNPTAPMRVPESPVITLAGGPTSGNFSTAGVQWAAVNHSTNAATQQITAKIFDRLLIFD